MTHAVARELLGAYLDGELDANAELLVRSHLDECPDCTNEFERLRDRQEMIRRGGLSYPAPALLESRIRRSLQPHRRPAVHWRQWGAVAAVLVLASTLSIRWWQGGRIETDAVRTQVVSSHVRALVTGHVADVVSTDRHTVKPWFSGRLDFSPPVADLAAQGFPLTGGRVDYLGGRTVATLVYMRQKHVIDVFVWPSSQTNISGAGSTNGFNTLLWSGAGMSFAAVSDLNAVELKQLRDLLPHS